MKIDRVKREVRWGAFNKLFNIQEAESNKLPFPSIKNLKEKHASTIDVTKEIEIGKQPNETTFISIEVNHKEQDDLKSLLR